MLNIEQNKVTIGYNKTLADNLRPLTKLMGLSEKEHEQYMTRAEIFADLCVLLDSIGDTVGREKAMEIWTKSAQEVTNDWKKEKGEQRQ